jgi:hypothetical protein
MSTFSDINKRYESLGNLGELDKWPRTLIVTLAVFCDLIGVGSPLSHAATVMLNVVY